MGILRAVDVTNVREDPLKVCAQVTAKHRASIFIGAEGDSIDCFVRMRRRHLHWRQRFSLWIRILAGADPGYCMVAGGHHHTFFFFSKRVESRH